ncbi:MAG: hypothetical protein ACRYF3_01955 [Janthinobacterium lividum]
MVSGFDVDVSAVSDAASSLHSDGSEVGTWVRTGSATVTNAAAACGPGDVAGWLGRFASLHTVAGGDTTALIASVASTLESSAQRYSEDDASARVTLSSLPFDPTGSSWQPPQVR